MAEIAFAKCNIAALARRGDAARIPIAPDVSLRKKVTAMKNSSKQKTSEPNSSPMAAIAAAKKADDLAKAAKDRSRVAKANFKAAKKALKLAKKASKKAAKQAKQAHKELKTALDKANKASKKNRIASTRKKSTARRLAAKSKQQPATPSPAAVVPPVPVTAIESPAASRGSIS